jgi:hypothetical protein
MWLALKSELKVALKTFGVAWLALTVALVLLCLFDSPDVEGVKDVLALLTFGVLICAFYTLWPALGVAACRMVYRILGWGAYAGAFLIAAGALTSLVLFRGWFLSLFLEIFEGVAFSGPCGAHGGGGVGVVIALFCLAAAVVTSPAAWWALLKLFLAVSLAILLGSLPGLLLWLVLLVRKVAKLASASISR